MTNPFGKKASLSFDVDLTDVPESGFYVEPGAYPAKIIGLDKEMSKGGNPMLVVEYALLEGRPGMQLKSWLSLNPKALFRVAEFVEAAGLGKRGDKLSIDPVAARNRRLVVHVKDDEYNGRTVSRVDSVAPHPGGFMMPATGKAALPKGKKLTTEEPADEKADDTDDIPF